MPEERTTHAKLSIDPETGEVTSRELHVVSDVKDKHTLLSLDLSDVLEDLQDDPPAA